MPNDTKFNIVAPGVLHCDGTGVWMETPKITVPKLSAERWKELYKYMEEFLIVGQYLNEAYWDDINPKQ